MIVTFFRRQSNNNFIVTGGCGFIGSHLGAVLHGQNVLVVDDCSKDITTEYKSSEIFASRGSESFTNRNF